mmetsp:Transcript_31068/g.51759  ORF Transcript_31068/g.51759 Transcript_31068/m.51759 type:complete len:131 (-) Transcript_31068:124-516(-)
MKSKTQRKFTNLERKALDSTLLEGNNVISFDLSQVPRRDDKSRYRWLNSGQTIPRAASVSRNTSACDRMWHLEHKCFCRRTRECDVFHRQLIFLLSHHSACLSKSRVVLAVWLSLALQKKQRQFEFILDD